MPPLSFWLAVAGHVGWFLLAAKIHGRSIRVERELRGHVIVSFGRDAQNHPWVEALWRKDRIRFWSTVATLAPIVFASVAIGETLGWPSPFRGIPVIAAASAAAVFWSMTAAFLANALASSVRFSRDVRDASLPGPEPDRDDWIRRLAQGTRFYWAAAVAVGALVIVAAFA